MPQYEMAFAVAVPRPLPYVAKTPTRADGSIASPARVKGMLIGIGPASVFYSIPVEQLRHAWIRTAWDDPQVDGSNFQDWGITLDEWVAERPPRPRPPKEMLTDGPRAQK